jgi:aspartate racemase
MKSICILGGMGPEASDYMYNTLIDLAVKDFGAKNNDQFPDITLFSVPVPDFISDELGKRKAYEMLRQKVVSVDKKSALCFSIACNTAHLLLGELQKNSSVPFISMIDEVVKKVRSEGFTSVGLLGTPMTIKSNLYSVELIQNNINVIKPTQAQINKLERVIRNVIAKKQTKNDQSTLKQIADDLKKRGAQAIILGCTELPLVFPKKYSLPSFNSVKILSYALLRKYYQQNTIKGIKVI